jgi:lipoprotein NlpI
MRIAVLCLLVAVSAACRAEQKPDPLKAELEKAEKAVVEKPNDVAARLRLGEVLLAMRENEKAEAVFDTVLKADPKQPNGLDRRGDARLKLGKFADAVADYDAFLALNPKFAPEHWRRGIALYYAGKHADGVKQFDTHKTVNPEDVENAAWHYLCNVKVAGKEKAQAALIAVTRDRRKPMAEIQKLFAGQLKPADVLKAAEETKDGTAEGVSARFYGNLYVALWYDAEGDAKKVKEHLTAAVEKYPVPDYMWDVGNAHLKALAKKK